ncbi:MAG TPA: GNAT family N-acetyltransferase [Anaerohalosphaeraceae bacterium]|nr:GNAT family N-acetyltransferase [Anaerohalosphaeraceae bacterium]HQJ67935.1 GNAT family N-acetyltransferase [Anaerohalosphaeraceae bacterium]
MNMNQSALIIRDMQMEDIEQVVKIHRRCFSERVSLFSALHPRLTWHLYAQYVEELESIGKVLVDPAAGRIAGFAAGTLRAGFQKRFLRSHFFLVCWYILLGLVSRAVVWKLLARAIFGSEPFNAYRKNPLQFEKTLPAGPVGYFMPIAIDPDYRGGGNSLRLARALMDYFFDLGIVRIRGNKIDIHNIPSYKLFVEKLGWSCFTIENQCYIVWKNRADEGKPQGDEEGSQPEKERWIPRLMKISEIGEVAELYMRCFPDRVNTALGKPYLEKFCLQALLEKESVVVVIEDSFSKHIVAAAAGTLRPGFGLRFIKRNKCFFASCLFHGFLKSSLIRKKVFQRIFPFSHKKSKSAFPQIDQETGQKIPQGTRLNHLFVCVDPDWQQKGLGKLILSYFMDTLFKMGAKRIWGCVETTNTASFKLHQSLGWKFQQTSEEWFTFWIDAPKDW